MRSRRGRPGGMGTLRLSNGSLRLTTHGSNSKNYTLHFRCDRLLYLGENQLTMLPGGIFSGLNNLTRLDLDENQLTTLPADIFRGLSRLQRLNLSENQLTTLPVGVFKTNSVSVWRVVCISIR